MANSRLVEDEILYFRTTRLDKGMVPELINKAVADELVQQRVMPRGCRVTEVDSLEVLNSRLISAATSSLFRAAPKAILLSATILRAHGTVEDMRHIQGFAASGGIVVCLGEVEPTDDKHLYPHGVAIEAWQFDRLFRAWSKYWTAGFSTTGPREFKLHKNLAITEDVNGSKFSSIGWFLHGVNVDDAWFRRAATEQRDELVCETPMAMARHGDGYFGFLGCLGRNVRQQQPNRWGVRLLNMCFNPDSVFKRLRV